MGGPVELAERAPSMVGDERLTQWWGRMLRMSVDPAGIAALLAMNAEIDIRHILPAIRVPTLLLHSPRDLTIEFGASRYMAALIPGARLIELPGPDHLPWLCDADFALGEIEEFLTGVRHALEPDRVLTRCCSRISSARQKKPRRLATAGGGIFSMATTCWFAVNSLDFVVARSRQPATGFSPPSTVPPGPSAAPAPCPGECSRWDWRSALAFTLESAEMMGDDMGGIAVHIGARIAALAAPGEVLVSGTVKDLVAGSGLSFRHHGACSELKAVPGDWRLFSVGVRRQSPRIGG